jgi:hypothetical protein
MNAAERYIAGLYEHAVDRGLDVPAIRTYLDARGLRRSVHQVEQELEVTYGFVGYAASHAPAPARTVEEWDRAIDQGRG